MQKITINGKSVFETEYKKNKFYIDGKSFDPDISEVGEKLYHILKDRHSYRAEIVELNAEEKKVTVKVNGNLYEAAIQDKYDLLLKELGLDTLTSHKINDMKAPMPGMVLDVKVNEGDEVSKGDAVLVLEAMKMENVLKAEGDGKVKEILVKSGGKVEKNEVLILFE